MKGECRFCDAPVTEKDIIVFQNENFYLTPTVGSFVDGYLLLNPKKHIFSMAQLSQEQLAEYWELSKEIALVQQEVYGVNPIIFEHGAARTCQETLHDSVVHAHTHFTPAEFSKHAQQAMLAQGKFQEFDRENLGQWSEVPYCMFINEDSNSFITHKSNLPENLRRQYVRRHLANAIGKGEQFEWREYPFYDTMTRTTAQLKEPMTKALTRKNYVNGATLQNV